MKILVIGSGGREHALVWKISQSPRMTKIYCAPGSAAIGELAELAAIAPGQIEKLADFASKEKIDLTVVGPELPLSLGIADRFSAKGRRLVGPTRAAAALESSKAFAKAFMARHRVPTARFQIADTITWVKQKDVFTFGTDIRKTQINSSLDRDFRPRVVFNGLRDGLTIVPGNTMAAAGIHPAGT